MMRAVIAVKTGGRRSNRRAWWDAAVGVGALVLGFSLSITVVAADKPAELRVAGSDLLDPGFSTALTAAVKSSGGGASVVLAGSRDAWVRLKAGQADLAIVTFAPDEPGADASLVAHPWAYHVAVIVAPASVPIEQLTLDQLGAVFGAEGYGAYREWRELGVTDTHARQPLFGHVLVGDKGGLAAEVFGRTALRTPRLRGSVVKQDDMAVLLDRLSADEGGLAIVPAIPEGARGLRVIAVAKSDKDPAYGPTQENVATGDYLLRWPMFVIYRAEDAVRLEPVLRFVWSDGAAAILAKSGLVALPSRARERMIEKVSGKTSESSPK